MSHPHKKNSAPTLGARTLLAEGTCRTAVLMTGTKSKVMNFTSAGAALKWCEANSTAFYYLPPQVTAQN